MPSTIASLFKESGLELSGQVNWGEKVKDDCPGVYIVSVAEYPGSWVNPYHQAPIDQSRLSAWIKKADTMKIDGCRPTVEKLHERLSGFWLPDETILHIGKAGNSIRRRVGQYYQTGLGDAKPHAGGHWLKTLSILDSLVVYWATAEDAEAMESNLLAAFIRNTSFEAKVSLFSREFPLPFANLEYPHGNRKRHGISGAKRKAGKSG